MECVREEQMSECAADNDVAGNDKKSRIGEEAETVRSAEAMSEAPPVRRRRLVITLVERV